jgi:hypothetical protein
MSDVPDWGRRGVSPPSHYKPLGDPTRWGAKVVQEVPLAAGQHILQSITIINAQCLDPYARQWSIVGTLAAGYGLWTFADGIGGPNTWASFIRVVMGVGQNQITHQINLRATVAADAPFYVDDPFQPTGQYFLTRAFVVPGSLIGSMLSIQVVNVVDYTLAQLPPGDQIATSLQVAPLAPGKDL